MLREKHWIKKIIEKRKKKTGSSVSIGLQYKVASDASWQINVLELSFILAYQATCSPRRCRECVNIENLLDG